ncbi:MAG: LCP family protein [Chloroflexota bacterium]|nr:LCP family protein [Chloroflexota bacterium]
MSDQRSKVKRIWPAFVLGILFISLVVGVIYASTAIYQWARETARSLPEVSVVSPPNIVLASRPQAGDVETTETAPQQKPAISSALPGTSPSLILPQVEQDNRITMLLLGVDQRPDDYSPPRTDNIIVVTVDPDTGNAGMISLPRDLYVPIPGFEQGGKINTAYVVGETSDYPGGGGALAKNTVSEFLGYPVDYYVKINFDGFEKVIDLLGGIDVVVPNTIHDEEFPTIDYGYSTFHIDAGDQHLDGETALKYVRVRNTDSDFERARRQQQVLIAVKDRVIENKLLAGLRIFDFLDVLADNIEHDIPASKVAEFVSLAGRVQIDDIERLVLDTKYAKVDPDSPYGWILVPDRERIRPAVDQVFSAKKDAPQLDVEALARLHAQQQAQQEAELARQQVRNDFQAQAEALRHSLAGEGARIVVQNGTSDPVLAARTADWLERQGYDVVQHGQAERTDYPRTVLISGTEKPFTTTNLKDMFAISDDNVLREDALQGNVDIQLIVGQDFYLLVSN